MLQAIRDKFTGVIALLIIGAIAITLVISFGGMDGGVLTGNFAAEVNGEEIPAINYQRVMQNQLYRQQEALQGELTPELQEQIQRNVLEGMIRNEVVKQFVRDAGFRIEDQRVMQQIARQEVFQVGGEYSYESYVMILANQGITPEGFERDQRAQMEIEQLENGIVASSFYTPAEYRRYIELLAEERVVAYLQLDAAELAPEVEVTDEQLREFYETNAEMFMTDESVRLEYVEVRVDDVKQGIEVTEAEVRDYYDANSDRFIAPDRRRVSHILLLIDDETDDAAVAATAADLRARLEQGESFEDLAREFSQDSVSAEDGGSLGWATPGDYPEAFEEALLELEPGQVSAPVRTEFGVHLIRLDEIREGTQQAYEDVREALFDELRTQAAIDEFYAQAERLDDLALENPGNLAAVAADVGLDLHSIETFTRTGGEPLGYEPALVDAVFSVSVLEDGENTPLIELGDERAVVASVTEHRNATQRPFDEVRALVEGTLRAQGAAQLARQRGEELLARLDGGESFAELADEYSFTVPEVATVTRATPDVPPDLLMAIYRAARPADDRPEFHGIGLANGNYGIFRLDEVVPGRPDMIPQQQRDQRKQMLAQQSGANAAAALIADLREAAKVVVAPGLFDQPEPL